MQPDPHLAAYAKGLEDAAQKLDDRARNERNRSEQHKATGKHYKAREAAHAARLAEQDAAAIRALSPLPPGSRVVVVPPDAEERMARAFIAHVVEPDEGILSWDDVPADDQTITLRGMTAALRALTGGEP